MKASIPRSLLQLIRKYDRCGQQFYKTSSILPLDGINENHWSLSIIPLDDTENYVIYRSDMVVLIRIILKISIEVIII